jgi:hypothetical protein
MSQKFFRLYFHKIYLKIEVFIQKIIATESGSDDIYRLTKLYELLTAHEFYLGNVLLILRYAWRKSRFVISPTYS